MSKHVARRWPVVTVKSWESIVSPDGIIEDAVSDFLDSLGSQIAHAISHTIEDDSFDWEAGNAKGTQHNYHPELTELVKLKFPTACPIIPTKIEGHYRGGGCPGEDAPHHKCGMACAEVETDFEAVLTGVSLDVVGWEAEYAIQT
jgi:hypothetical protein